MNRRLLGFLVFALVLVGAEPQPISRSAFDLATAGLAAAEQQQDPTTITVYITRTGKKYHREGCRHLSRSKIPTNVKAAVERRYGPCSVCRPPTTRSSR